MRRHGFTLSELLVALAILGVIATFTIPKVLEGSNSSRYNAIVEEAAASLSAIYHAEFVLTGNRTTSMGALHPEYFSWD